MKKACLIGAGEALPAWERMARGMEEAELVLCADGGYDVLLRHDRQPDFVLGDFDSSRDLQRKENLARLEQEGRVLRFPVRKDETDMELALDYLLEHGFTEALVFGAFGSRLDHSLCNFWLLPRFAKEGLSVTLETQNNVIRYLTPGQYTLPRRAEEWYTSFLPMEGEVRLTLEGFDYPLERHGLLPHTSLGISNHVLTEDNRVIVEEAGVFCFQSRDGKVGD